MSGRRTETSPAGQGSLCHSDEEKQDPPASNVEKGLEAELQPPITNSPSKTFTYLAITGAYFLLLINSLIMTVTSSLSPYVTSEFQSHSILPVIGIVSFIVTGIIQLPLSRIIDLYGRPRGLVAMVLLDVLGIIVMATCQSVEAYAAAQVLYGIGSDGVIYVIRVFGVDKVHTRSRSLVYGLSMYTYFITPFAGPAIAQAFYKAGKWRWAFGTLAIVFSAASSILIGLFMWNESRLQAPHPTDDREEGKPAHANGRTLWRAIWFHAIEFDVVGMLLACFGLSLLLLPLSLSTSGINGWASPTTISMLVIGAVSLALLVFYEKLLSPKSFVDLRLLQDRTVMGACLCLGGQSLSTYIWYPYYTSFLQVVHFCTLRDAGYILNANLVGSAVFSILGGHILQSINHFKLANAIGLVTATLGTGLMILFSSANSPFAGVVASQVVVSTSHGILAVSQVAAILHSAKPADISIRMCLIFLFATIAAAIGSTIATPLWRSSFPKLLARYLPSDLKAQAPRIFGSLATQLSYEAGTRGRDAIIRAMTETWKQMTIVGTALLGLAWIGVFMMRGA